MSMDNHKDMEEEMFWIEMQELAHVFSELVVKYGMQDRVISALVVGILEEVSEEQSNMKTFTTTCKTNRFPPNESKFYRLEWRESKACSGSKCLGKDRGNQQKDSALYFLCKTAARGQL